jgi:PiT family inorganic phosphate transporter
MAASTTVMVATRLNFAVSTTHSIIGGIVGFALVWGGADAINWEQFGLVVGSWFASPISAYLYYSFV